MKMITKSKKSVLIIISILLIIATFSLVGCSTNKSKYSLKELPKLEKEEIANKIPAWVDSNKDQSPLWSITLPDEQREGFDAEAISFYKGLRDPDWTEEQSDAIYLGKGMYCTTLNKNTTPFETMKYPCILNGVIVSWLSVSKDVDGSYIPQLGPIHVNEVDLLKSKTSKEQPLRMGYINGHTVIIIENNVYDIFQAPMSDKKIDLNAISDLDENLHIVNIMEEFIGR